MIGVAGLVVAAAGIGFGVASATIPDAGGVFHACISSAKTGTPSPNVRIIDTGDGQSCGAGEHAAQWNQTGAQGPAGPSDAFAKVIDGPLSAPVGSSTIASLSISLPGKYVISSKMVLTYDSGLFTSVVYECSLQAGSDSDVTRGSTGGEGSTPNGPAPVSGLIVNSVVHEFTSPGTIDLKCSLGNPSSLNFIKITAIKVGSLTTS